MDIGLSLNRATEMVPGGIANEAGSTVATVREFLRETEWEVALGLLADLYEQWDPPPGYWDLLVGAAEAMGLPGMVQWCRWGRFESLHGIIRAELAVPAGARQEPIPGRGVLRPLWGIGQPGMCMARVWVEAALSLPPGTTGTVRLAPLVPAEWREVRPGLRVTMHEDGRATAAGVILEHRLPAPAAPQD